MLRPWGRTVHVDMWVSLRGKPQGKGVELRPMGYGAVLRLRLLVVWRARSVGTRTHSPAKANWARAGVFTARDRKQLLSPDFRSDVLARLLFNWSKKLRRSRQVLLHMVDSGIKKQTKPMRALTHTGRWVRIKDIHSCRERDQGIMTLEVTVRALGCEGELWETGEAPTTGYKVTGLSGTRSQRCPHSSFPKSYSHLPPLPEGLLLLPNDPHCFLFLILPLHPLKSSSAYNCTTSVGLSWSPPACSQDKGPAAFPVHGLGWQRAPPPSDCQWAP